ncbi:MAG TPA: hypothetical protein VHP31_09165 [Caproicibacter sp.]|nr:hypothetical protein [Caproicibacter sp.]
MKQFMLRHEKVITWILSMVCVTLNFISIILIFIILIKGMFCGLTHFTLPVSYQKATSYISNFIFLWVAYSITSFFLLLFDYDLTIKKRIQKSVIWGFLAEIFFVCLVFSCYDTDKFLITYFFVGVFNIAFIFIRRFYEKVIAHMKKEKVRELIQCLIIRGILFKSDSHIELLNWGQI